MVALIASLIILGLCTGIIILVALRSPHDAPLTWGEAFVAATFVFGVLFLAYGIVPHQFLAAADNEWKWRSDKFGIPLGPFGDMLGLKNPMFEDGVTFFGRGRVLVSAQTFRDIIVTGLYVGLAVVHFGMWAWWQKRGKRAAETPELTSAYGRPLVRKV